MATIYALLVGIEGYTRKPLDGCINDVNAVHEGLKKLYSGPATDLKVKVLTDRTEEKPTRANMVRAFSFFDAATAEDTCLFYYSGHGSFSIAPPEFRSDNGFLQSFVCLDSRLPGGRDLMDKEMSYLIWQATKDKPGITFVSIVDCCHSGTINKEAHADDLVRERLLPPDSEHLPARLTEYLGYGTEGAYRIANTPGGKVINVSQGPHLHLSASADSQTAKELAIGGLVRGAFTYSLLKTLYACNGRVSYRELAARTAAAVANMINDQQPGITVNGGLPGSEKDKDFLGRRLSGQDTGYLVYRDKNIGWRINAGLLHNVQKGDIVSIDGIEESLVIKEPMPDYAYIQEIDGLVSGTEYRGTVERATERAVVLGIAGAMPGNAAAHLETAVSRRHKNTLTLGTLSDAEYWIAAGRAGIYLAYPGTERPVFKPIIVNDSEDAVHFLDEVKKVIRWKQLRELYNPQSLIKDNDYRIDLYREATDGSFELVDWATGPADLYYLRKNGEWLAPVIKLTFTNLGKAPLWVTNAYLGFDFGVIADLFEEVEVGHDVTIPIGISGDIDADKLFKLEIDERYGTAGYQSIREYIKLFISTAGKVSTDGMAQKGVELPPVGQAMGAFAVSRSEQGGSGWQTATIGFNIVQSGDGIAVTSGSPAFLGALSVTAPTGFSATAALNSSLLTERGADGAVAPNRVFNNTSLSPWDLTKGYRTDNVMDVLELSGVQGGDQISAENPLLLRLGGALTETVLPFGVDSETGMGYPLGFMDRNGAISLSILPEETATDQAITNRSFSGSVKIYFQKVVGSKLGLPYTYPRLALASVNADGEPVYDSDPTILSDAIAGSKNILLFIHGIIGDTEGMVKCTGTKLTGGTLIGATDIVLAFDYENLNTTIEDNAELLNEALEKAGLKPGHGKNLTIAAHSMGGLVSRHFIEHLDGSKVVTRLVMLGTPNNGTPWADVRDLAAALLTFAINGAAMLKPAIALLSIAGRWSQGLQVTLKQMNTETGIYHGLNTGADPGIPYTVIAGNTNLLIPRYGETAGLIVRVFSRLRQRGLYDALDALLFNEPNDIAVTDESINKLPGAEVWTVPPVYHQAACDHLNYFNNEEALSFLLGAIS
jgi:pimeloyl-ACP methyl ester carboxylesterase